MHDLKPSPGLHCANCAVALQGEFCHACGQSIHSVLRPVSHMLEDAGDIFFHMDERIIHTVPPLFTKPGFLTLEYFSGRRIRYVAPFRLMFVFCLLCFFFMHLALNDVHLIKADPGDLRQAQMEAVGNAPTGEAVKTDIHLRLGWLPESANTRLDGAFQHLMHSVSVATTPGPQQKAAQERMIEGVFGVLPQTMFIMVPVFALVLKLFYLFRRRLYMEHVIVALHSHAFLFLSLMLMVVLGLASTAIKPHLAAGAKVIGLVQLAMWVWMPVYLFLMQKRIYRQGWGMTILKFWLIGSVYFWLLLGALTIALLIGISH